MEQRLVHYESFDLRADASQAPEQVAWEIQCLLGRYYLRGMGRGYDVLVEEGGLQRLGQMLKLRELGGPILVVSDTNVAPLYGNQVMNSLRSA